MSLRLYYDNQKGLVKSQDYAYGDSIQEHDEKNYKDSINDQTLEIPDRNTKIVVRTKLHRGSASYMHARISLMGKTVFDFLDTSLRHSVKIVYAKPGDWNALFDSIINLYNNIYNSETPIIKFFDVIKEAINENESNIDTMTNVASRLSEILDGLSNSIYADNKILHDRLRDVCGLFIQYFSKERNNVQLTTQRQIMIEKTLQKVFKYLTERDEILSVLTQGATSNDSGINKI